MTKWEYRTERLAYARDDTFGCFYPDPSVEGQLNEWAKEGWELVSVSEGLMYLRRRPSIPVTTAGPSEHKAPSSGPSV